MPSPENARPTVLCGNPYIVVNVGVIVVDKDPEVGEPDPGIERQR
jgi:hypothetical protein